MSKQSNRDTLCLLLFAQQRFSAILPPAKWLRSTEGSTLRFELPIAYCPLPSRLVASQHCGIYAALRIAYCPLPIAYCPLLIAFPLSGFAALRDLRCPSNCLLLIAHCLPA
jgi:hypothetical protein